MTVKENTARIEILEKKINKIINLLWYIAGIISLKFGSETIPNVMALVVKGG